MELVDTTDLKSVGCISRAGSSPASGTRRETSPTVGFIGIILIFTSWHIMEYFLPAFTRKRFLRVNISYEKWCLEVYWVLIFIIHNIFGESFLFFIDYI